MLKNNGFKCVIAASDTFRAAAIEQLIEHSKRLGVEVISNKYGSDPASVAFDAITHAKSKNYDVVLIDTAGRQNTNENLIKELKKMIRVTNPDLKIFVGEAIAGNALLEQVNAFNKELGIDAIILTKLDCDAKGGNTLSILVDTNIPIAYFGVGEAYNDIEPYNPERIVDELV